ncbi:DUF6599 family protein [Bacteroidota bacterium]
MNKTYLLILILSFFLSHQEKANAQANYFPKIDNWEISDDIQTFNAESLYEYINGAADLYIIYDFQELKVATYISSVGEESAAEIDVEVYDQENSTDAYGVYSQERPSKPEKVNIGAQAYKEGSMLNFISGRYYVKIDSHDNSDNTKKSILAIAKQLAKSLCESPALPEMLNVFPEEGKIPNSDMFVAKDFLGHGFLTDVYKNNYKEGDINYTLLLIKKENKAGCEDIIRKYLKFCKQSTDNVNEGEYRLSDRYNGEIHLIWKNNSIWGILSKDKYEKSDDKLIYIEEQLKKIK